MNFCACCGYRFENESINFCPMCGTKRSNKILQTPDPNRASLVQAEQDKRETDVNATEDAKLLREQKKLVYDDELNELVETVTREERKAKIGKVLILILSFSYLVAMWFTDIFHNRWTYEIITHIRHTGGGGTYTHINTAVYFIVPAFILGILALLLSILAKVLKVEKRVVFFVIVIMVVLQTITLVVWAEFTHVVFTGREWVHLSERDRYTNTVLGQFFLNCAFAIPSVVLLLFSPKKLSGGDMRYHEWRQNRMNDGQNSWSRRVDAEIQQSIRRIDDLNRDSWE